MAIRALTRQGVNISYKHITSTYDQNTGGTSESTTTETVKAYPKHLVANQYNYPALINKSMREFYIIGNALSSVPKENDEITFNSEKYSVVRHREHIAGGEVCLYCIIAVKQ